MSKMKTITGLGAATAIAVGLGYMVYQNDQAQRREQFPLISLYGSTTAYSFDRAYAFAISPNKNSAQKSAKDECVFESKTDAELKADKDSGTIADAPSCTELTTLSGGVVQGLVVQFSGQLPTFTQLYNNDGMRNDVAATCGHYVTVGRSEIICDQTAFIVNDAAALQSLADEINAPYTVTGIGVMVRPYDDYILIEKVLSQGPAQKAGLQSGDIITSLNGNSTQNQTPGEFIAGIRDDADANLSLVIRRGDETKTIAATRETMLIGQGAYVITGPLPPGVMKPADAPRLDIVTPKRAPAPITYTFWRVTSDAALHPMPHDTKIIRETVKEGSCIMVARDVGASFLNVAAITADNKEATGFSDRTNFERLTDTAITTDTCRAEFR